MADDRPSPITLSVVIPVYRGAKTLEAVVAELEPLVAPQKTPAGRAFRLAEVLLVHDGAVDDSARVMQELAARFSFVTLIWLSRNYGQHPATLAGMASTSGGWVVTIDEDGQHDPRHIGELLDQALDQGAHLVYGLPANAPPHGLLRNAASRAAKLVFVGALDSSKLGHFSSYRLVWGEIARSVAAYCGNGVYLDVALSWVVGRSTFAPVLMRSEGDRRSGYDFSKLISHFWRMVLTSGTRPLRLIALLGCVSILGALGLSGYAIYQKLTRQVPIAGWTSTIIATSFFGGAILFSLGVIAEYLGFAIHMAMGKPTYLLVSRPSSVNGPR
jgi:undecaprenyl-phosphate 4-deoxy-4-formamido-L-arabinose transferase